MENTEEKTKYSAEELEEFRQIILKKIEEAKDDMKMLDDAAKNSGENDINDTSPTFKVLEEGYNVMSKEENSQFAVRQGKFIKSLEAALERIDNGTYGICRETGKLISKERLRSVPHATLSIDAKKRMQKP
ncbi:MAG: molecular chaperone DnaK [Bacteroidetes bacterium CG2_30_33_31]|nr:MAG: molecular chaperone DnaK [Bacteroidetes bacterium CG2_30_33_31]